MSVPLNVSCCYAHQDQSMLEHLKNHLASLLRQGQITIWSDFNLAAGMEWEKEQHQHMESADIILLLISPDFMNSDYCYSTEIIRTIERHNERSAVVIPILLRPTFWRNASFAEVQMLPTDAKPLTSWSNRDEAFMDIAVHISRVALDLQTRSMQRDVNGQIRTGNNAFIEPTVVSSVTYRLSEVFVKSGFPNVTFVEREDFVLLKLALEQSGRGVIIEGPSGIGKTTSVEKVVKDLEIRYSHLSMQQVLSARNPIHRNRLQTIREWHNGTVIIDDFHRLDADLRHELVDYLKELVRVHLKPIEHEGTIDLWDDTKIAAGLQWKEAIMNALETACVAVLLVSAQFLASDFIAEHELPKLLDRARTSGTIIIPIILSPSLFTSTKLGAFQAVNDPKHPLTTLSYAKQETILVKVAEAIAGYFRTE